MSADHECTTETALLWFWPVVGTSFWVVVACAFLWPMTTAWVVAAVGNLALLLLAGLLLFRGLRGLADARVGEEARP